MDYCLAGTSSHFLAEKTEVTRAKQMENEN